MSCLFIYDFIVAGGSVENWEVSKLGQLLNLIGLNVIVEQVELAIPVGEKIDPIPNPHGIDVITPAFRLRYLLYRMITESIKPYCRNSPSPVIFPLAKAFREWIVSHSLAVGRIGCLESIGDFQ